MNVLVYQGLMYTSVDPLRFRPLINVVYHVVEHPHHVYDAIGRSIGAANVRFEGADVGEARVNAPHVLIIDCAVKYHKSNQCFHRSYISERTRQFGDWESGIK